MAGTQESMPNLEARPRTPERDTKAAKSVAPSYALIIRILNLVRNEADMPVVENELKQDIALSYRLMRYINSAGMGFPSQITSYRQAVTILGYHELYRWLTLLLLTADPNPVHNDIVKASIVRGRFLELVGKLRFQRAQADDLFVVGIFSRIDELFGQPMATVLEAIRISDDMRGALLDRSGPYGELLALAEALDGSDGDVRGSIENRLGLEPPAVDDAYETARSWAANVRQ
jgi:EAL and modified HD-GYP domain-containing signal transduction protein